MSGAEQEVVMPKTLESKYADLLIELGFEKVRRTGEDRKLHIIASSTGKPATALNGPAAFSASSNRAKLSIIRNHLPERPLFLNVGGLVTHTFVMDEVGEHWIANEIIDLSSEGFDNALNLLGKIRNPRKD